MDTNMLIILLKLFFDGPQDFEELRDGLRKDLGGECPWGENELGIDLHAILEGSDYISLTSEGKYSITNSGMEVLHKNKKLSFIFKTMNWKVHLQAAGRI